MKLLTEAQYQKLLANGFKGQQEVNFDPSPVVKLFTPWGACTWLLTELDPAMPDIAFGLCDLGLGFPEIGSVSLSELQSVKGPFGLSVERDRHFKARQPLSAYAEDAHQRCRIRA